MMRYWVVLLWSFLLGQVVGYIGAALKQTPYNFTQTTIVSLIAGIVIMIIGWTVLPKQHNTTSNK